MSAKHSLFDEWALEPRLGVGVRVPGLLFHRQRGLGQEGLEPAGQMRPNMVDLVGELETRENNRYVCFLILGLKMQKIAFYPIF